MANFFEKLKRGMGIEEKKEVKEKPTPPAKLRKLQKESEPPAEKIQKIEIKTMPLERKEEGEIKKPAAEAVAREEKWLESEGQLAVDVYQTETDLVLQSAIAGIKPEDLDISLEGDVLTITGERKKPFEESGDYFSQECYWGKFSRQIILPVEVDPNRIEATLKNGILTIRIPKIQREKKRRIIVKD